MTSQRKVSIGSQEETSLVFFQHNGTYIEWSGWPDTLVCFRFYSFYVFFFLTFLIKVYQIQKSNVYLFQNIVFTNSCTAE